MSGVIELVSLFITFFDRLLEFLRINKKRQFFSLQSTSLLKNNLSSSDSRDLE